MILAVIISIAAPDVEAHPTHGLEHLDAVSRQVAGGHEQIDVGQVMAVQSARQG